MKPHLTHLFLQVGSLERARWFWVDVLGLQVIQEHPGYLAVGGNGGFALGIEEAPAGQVDRGGPEFTMRVPDVDAMAVRLRSFGVETEGDPRDQPWGARHVWLRDPDGRRMSIYSIGHNQMGLPDPD
ncbi:MAG: VOC family protein [bacterium]